MHSGAFQQEFSLSRFTPSLRKATAVKKTTAVKKPTAAKVKLVKKFGPLAIDVRVEHVVQPGGTACAIAYYSSPGPSPNAFNLVRNHEYTVTHIRITDGSNKGKCKLKIKQGPYVLVTAARAAIGPDPFPPPSICECGELMLSVDCPPGQVPHCDPGPPPSMDCVSTVIATKSKAKKK